MTPRIVAVDHFAGTGWGVACHWLGILEYGVEKMHEAIRTRTRAGFRTIYRDVWSGLFHPWLVPLHRLYIASPPCQTFSVAGRGEGRKALEQVLALVASGAWKDPARLLAAGGDLGDERTALVLTPLAHIWAHRPELIALEQVPTVLPVWEAIADVLRGLGYSVWVGNMQAEQYGVPQTRKRAILIARADGVPARPPRPDSLAVLLADPRKAGSRRKAVGDDG
ncbi:DNA cytosine methyltransferase [Microbacterium allomyrinae]|uniref:DNA (cytosine-5-)-methyltransferase n=1 Tax=Microbacterium allomyrinae TaxID=2830666 RepID=A0A9X1LRK9_9MICO|nr:DNA cytosine methyltransferase [Microbacterium allomyrinae]MCC2030640.1 DNA cytosine methyltransferase [Microbacterium allomyrinae]